MSFCLARPVLGRVYTCVLSLSLLLWCADASATALIVDGPDGVDAWPEARTARLVDLAVDVQIDAGGATIVEDRQYVLEGLFDERERTSLTVVRTLPDHGDAATVRIVVDGDGIDGALLTGDEADDARLGWTRALHDPAPVRHMGAALYQSEAVDLQAYAASRRISVRIETRHPLARRGTLRGLCVPVDWGRAPVDRFTLNVEADTAKSLRTLYAPYDELSVQRTDGHRASASHQGWHRTPDFDVDLFVSEGDAAWHLDILPFRSPRDGGFFTALLSVDDSLAETARVSRDIVFVLDRSGSMQGSKIDQARQALTGVIERLEPDDRFSVVAFDGAVATWSADAVEADAANRQSAVDFVRGIEPAGGTNIYDALETAYDTLPFDRDRPRYVVLLTDGQPTEGETDAARIVEQVLVRNEVGARVYALGIGHDVNTVLLDRLGRETHGDALYIPPNASVADAVERFFSAIEAPVLGDPRLDVSLLGGFAMQPGTLQDLYAGNTVVISGRYETAGAASFVLEGRRGGAIERHVFSVALPALELREGHVPRVWARRRVGALLRDVKLGNTDPAVVAEATALAERYGVVTDFTRFEVNADGDTEIQYESVPTDSAGSRAVATSAGLDEVEKDDAFAGPDLGEAATRFALDRTLPLQSGYFTDTTVATMVEPPWTELHFGSERWAALASDEGSMGTASLLAAGRQLRVEHLGRFFRVHDAMVADDTPPLEAEVIPAADVPESTVAAEVAYVGVLADGVAAPELIIAGTVPVPAMELTPEAPGNEASVGCSAGAGSSSAPAALALLGMALGLIVTRRRRTAA